MWIFSANTSPSAPPNTVKSWLNTNTLRPSTVPHPVMTPSVYGRSSRPAAWARWRASRSSSWKLPGSRKYSIRSRASILPFSCWRSTDAWRAGVVRLLAPLAQIVELVVPSGCAASLTPTRVASRVETLARALRRRTVHAWQADGVPFAASSPARADAGQAADDDPDGRRAGCTSRSGTASAASCSATATRSSWPAATSARSPATSPS